MSECQYRISDLIHDVELELIQLGYSEASLRNYRCVWRKFMIYTETHGDEFYISGYGPKYLWSEYGIDVTGEKPCPLKKKQKWYFRRPIVVLDTFFEKGQLFKQAIYSTWAAPKDFFDIWEEYEIYCDRRYASKRGIKAHLFGIKSFLDYIHNMKVPHLKDVSGIHISGFIRVLEVRGLKTRTIDNIFSSLRGFFRFLENKGYPNLSIYLPQVKRDQRTLPTIWSKEDSQRVLDAVDRGNPSGKRDYAILLLAIRLGIRDCDIRNLKFENIDWSNERLSFTQLKTGLPLELPLSNEIGSAIIDYLKCGRPHINLSYLFIRHIAPFDQFESLYNILQRYLRAAGVSFDREKAHGMHSFRHTLASDMLAANASLESISGVLGHKTVDSTNTYLTVNIEGLRECALNPEKVF